MDNLALGSRKCFPPGVQSSSDTVCLSVCLSQTVLLSHQKMKEKPTLNIQAFTEVPARAAFSKFGFVLQGKIWMCFPHNCGIVLMSQF